MDYDDNGTIRKDEGAHNVKIIKDIGGFHAIQSKIDKMMNEMSMSPGQQLRRPFTNVSPFENTGLPNKNIVKYCVAKYNRMMSSDSNEMPDVFNQTPKALEPLQVSDKSTPKAERPIPTTQEKSSTWQVSNISTPERERTTPKPQEKSSTSQVSNMSTPNTDRPAPKFISGCNDEQEKSLEKVATKPRLSIIRPPPPPRSQRATSNTPEDLTSQKIQISTSPSTIALSTSKSTLAKDNLHMQNSTSEIFPTDDSLDEVATKPKLATKRPPPPQAQQQTPEDETNQKFQRPPRPRPLSPSTIASMLSTTEIENSNTPSTCNNSLTDTSSQQSKRPPRPNPLILPFDFTSSLMNNRTKCEKKSIASNSVPPQKSEISLSHHQKELSKNGITSEKASTSDTNNLFQGYSIDKFLKPHHIIGHCIETEMEFQIPNLDRPIGLTALKDGSIVVAITGMDSVHMYNPKGRLVKVLKSCKPFRRPSDMVCLPDGRFLLRDNSGVHLFEENGEFIKMVGVNVLGRCFGLATDGQGNLIAINVGSPKSPITKPGETDVLFINIEDGKVTRRIILTDIIRDKANSKCRFCACDGKSVYVVDLGLDCIYCVGIVSGTVKTFGGTGRQIGKFQDPAGMVIDNSGNLIIADAKNNRLQILDKNRNFLGLIHSTQPLRRPSGIALDPINPGLYVLNLNLNTLYKFKLVQN